MVWCASLVTFNVLSQYVALWLMQTFLCLWTTMDSKICTSQTCIHRLEIGWLGNRSFDLRHRTLPGNDFSVLLTGTLYLETTKVKSLLTSPARQASRWGVGVGGRILSTSTMMDGKMWSLPTATSPETILATCEVCFGDRSCRNHPIQTNDWVGRLLFCCIWKMSIRWSIVEVH